MLLTLVHPFDSTKTTGNHSVRLHLAYNIVMMTFDQISKNIYIIGQFE